MPQATPENETPRKRPKPGERRIQILQTLALMLEQPAFEKITTAALAEKLSVSEAALYRQFASKAQMYEGLIEYIEDSVSSLITKITEHEEDPMAQVHNVLSMLLKFSEKNPGMVRVMTGEALVNENARLQTRINLFFDRVEASIKQSIKIAVHEKKINLDPGTFASILICFVQGRMQRYTKSGFKRLPTEQLEQVLRILALK